MCGVPVVRSKTIFDLIVQKKIRKERRLSDLVG